MGLCTMLNTSFLPVIPICCIALYASWELEALDSPGWYQLHWMV